MTTKLRVNSKFDFSFLLKFPSPVFKNIATTSVGFHVSDAVNKERKIKYGFQLEFNVWFIYPKRMLLQLLIIIIKSKYSYFQFNKAKYYLRSFNYRKILFKVWKLCLMKNLNLLLLYSASFIPILNCVLLHQRSNPVKTLLTHHSKIRYSISISAIYQKVKQYKFLWDSFRE